MRNKHILRLMLHEWSMLIYLAFGIIFMLVAWNQLELPGLMIQTRLTAVAMLLGGLFIHWLRPCHLTHYLRIVMVMLTLSVWYPDTYEMNRIFPSYDHLFARWDQAWFGCQPSLVFSLLLPQTWVSELFYLGYFSYFPMIWLVITWICFRQPRSISRVPFIVFTSFMLYYLIYIFLPVGGPQFYYQAEGVDAAAGIFPEVGHYFNTHAEMFPAPGGDNLFHGLVNATQTAGERPTAAFPSSHIGISTILLILCWCYRQRILLLCILPLYVLLCGATVYIHAHYLVDAIFGLLSAPLVYKSVSMLYGWLSRQRK